MAVIELQSISKEYRNDASVTPALSDVDLKIDTGEFVAIMGASGSGKTTLLNIIGCMDVSTAGTYLFEDEPLSNAKESRLSAIRGKRISFVFQHFALIDDYTVFENVEIPLIKQAMSKAERKKAVLSALKLVGISDLAKKKPTHISGGQKQRAAIARAIACGADTILADEPTGALNQSAAQEVMQAFLKLNGAGTSILMVTHDSRVASRCERILYLLDGKLRGELALGKFKSEEERLREQKVSDWLGKLGW